MYVEYIGENGKVSKSKTNHPIENALLLEFRQNKDGFTFFTTVGYLQRIYSYILVRLSPST
jgi:hypothetical protein